MPESQFIEVLDPTPSTGKELITINTELIHKVRADREFNDHTRISLSDGTLLVILETYDSFMERLGEITALSRIDS